MSHGTQAVEVRRVHFVKNSGGRTRREPKLLTWMCECIQQTVFFLAYWNLRIVMVAYFAFECLLRLRVKLRVVDERVNENKQVVLDEKALEVNIVGRFGYLSAHAHA